MFENLKNLKIIETIYATSADYLKVTKRFTHIIVARLCGKCEYSFDGKRVTVEEGEGIFLPCGSSYTVEVVSEQPSRYALLRFTADMDFTEITKFYIDDFKKYMLDFEKLNRTLVFENEKNALLSLSVFYGMLARLRSGEERVYFDMRKIEHIKPAINYIEEHIFDSNLSIGKLGLLCGISDVYFRQLFLRYTGKTPSKYITEKRLERAKSLLDEGDYFLIRDVAEAVGYEDPLYFSRIFKKHYGYSPRENLHNEHRNK